MNYDILAAELGKPEYAELSDQEVADRLNAETVVVRRPVATRDIFIAAMRMGLILTLRTVTLDTTMAPGLRALAQTALDLTDQTVLESVDMDDPASVSLLDALIEYGLMTDEQANQFGAMATVMSSWATLNCNGSVGAHHVAYTRAGGG